MKPRSGYSFMRGKRTRALFCGYREYPLDHLLHKFFGLHIAAAQLLKDYKKITLMLTNLGKWIYNMDIKL